jgi:hypothetical protein
MARGTVRVTKTPTSIETRSARTCAGQPEADGALHRSLRSRSKAPAIVGVGPPDTHGSLNSRSEALGTVTSQAQHPGEAVSNSHQRCHVRLKQTQPGTYGTEGRPEGRGTGRGTGVAVGVGVGSGWSQPGSWADPPL